MDREHFKDLYHKGQVLKHNPIGMTDRELALMYWDHETLKRREAEQVNLKFLFN
jgi:hypothetical protein